VRARLGPRLSERVGDAAAERRLLALVGLGMRSRGVVIGVDQVKAAAKGGSLALAVVASDAARNSREKLLPLLAARQVTVLQGPSAEALGAALGRGPTVAVGVVDRALANGMRAAGVAAVKAVQEDSGE
jgi:ribosomal protein L7Ae-like RNA K-turn-binding protein